MLHISQKRSCLFECDCMVLCLHMCVIFPGCKSSVFVFLVIRVPDSGSGSALQYLVPPKPPNVPACLRELISFFACHSCSRVHVISGSCCAGVCVSCNQSSGSDLQYLVLPKPTIVPACLREFVIFCVCHSCSRVHVISGSCCAGVCVSCNQSSGSALQYLVPPKPTIVPAGIQPSHSSPWSLT